MLTSWRKSHKVADVLRFFKLIDHVDKDLDVHAMDNLSTHNSRELKKWLADPARAC